MNDLPKLLTTSKSTEVYSTADLIIDKYEESSLSSDENLAELIEQLKTENKKLVTAIAAKKTKSTLKQNNAVRNGYYTSINNLLKGYTYHPEEEIKVVAQSVYKVFFRFNKPIYNKGYAERSSLINSLIKDLSEETLQSNIDKLSGLRTLIEKLSEANTNFDKTWVNFEAQQAEEGQRESATQISPKVVAIINKQLIVYLRGMMAIDKEKYKDFALTIGRVINENNMVVKKRGKKEEEIV